MIISAFIFFLPLIDVLISTSSENTWQYFLFELGFLEDSF